MSNSKVEWFKGDLPTELFKEAENLLYLVGKSNRCNHILSFLTGAPSDFNNFGVGISHIVLKFEHWSRKWEYPWIIVNGGFEPGQHVMDAGGAGSILGYRLSELGCKVIILDKDPERLVELDTYSHLNNNIKVKVGDIHDIPYPDDTFDRVICCSVLEHCEGPVDISKELWRVVRPGGKLIITMDVTESNYLDGANCVNDKISQEILDRFGLKLPDSKDAVKNTFSDGKTFATLRVLGFCCEKNLCRGLVSVAEKK